MDSNSNKFRDLEKHRHSTILEDLKEIKRFVNNEYWRLSSCESLDGFSIFVEFAKRILKENVQAQVTAEQIKFKILLEERYPFKDPQILCLTDFLNNETFSISDGRDLFNEVVGQDGWKCDYPLYKLIWLLPDFVEEMLSLSQKKESKTHFVGTFHLGMLYDIREIKTQSRQLSTYKTVFDVQE